MELIEILSALVNSERIIGYSRWAADPEISFLTEEEFQKLGNVYIRILNKLCH